MRAEIQHLRSGWSDVRLRLTRADIKALITALHGLNANSHFHLRATFESSQPPGIADFEISLQGDEEEDNVTLE